MLQIYTGEGKGKTSAALGLAFRALGHEKKVLMVQFMKKGQGLGELKAAQRFPKFKIFQAGRCGWVIKDAITLKDKQMAQKGWSYASWAIESNKYNYIILDELNVAIDFGLVSVREVKAVLKNKPKNLEIVITGRNAHPEILKIADLVSEIREIKHYYKKGVCARQGVEF